MRINLMRSMPSVEETLAGGTVIVSGQRLAVLRALVLEKRGVPLRLLKAELGVESVPSEISRLRESVGDDAKIIIRTEHVQGETGYRLYLREGDTVDAVEFEKAALEHGLSQGDFDKIPAGYGANVEMVRELCELMAANPGWPDSQIDAVRTAAGIYDEYQWRLQLGTAYGYIRRWIDRGTDIDVTTGVAFLKRLVVGEATSDDVWRMLIRIEGSLANWKMQLPELERQIAEAHGGSVPPQYRDLLQRCGPGRDQRLLLKPARSTGVVVDNPDAIPTRVLTADEQGNLADVAVRLGISSNAALRLRDSRVEPSECIDKTVSRLWFAGVLGGKWTLDTAVLAKFELLLDRLDTGEDADDVVGKPVRLLLLDPASRAFADQVRIGALRASIADSSLAVLRDLVLRHPALAVHMYDSPPMFRMIIIDDSMVTVGPYLSVPAEFVGHGGWDTPHLVLTSAAQYPLAKSFEMLFRDMWRRSKPLT